MYFKIKNPDGLYSKGGHNPRFTKKGKTWSTMGYLKRHLSMIDYDPLEVYENCTIEIFDDVNFTLSVVDIKPIIEEFKAESQKKSKEKKIENLLRQNDYIKKNIESLWETFYRNEQELKELGV